MTLIAKIWHWLRIILDQKEKIDAGKSLSKIKKMSLITTFDPWKGKLCSCPEKYSLSAYTGCGNGCLYCYASSYIRSFFKPRPKKDYLERLKKEIEKIPASAIITIANSSDPYQLLEETQKLTRKTLEILRKTNCKINIITKSSLILRDLGLLKNLNTVVCISFTTLDRNLAKKLEPNASSPKERLDAIKKLSRYLPVVVRFDPLIYPLTTENIKKTIHTINQSGPKQIITSTYKIKPDNFKRMLKVFPQYRNLWQKLYFKEGERIGGYTYLKKQLREKLINAVFLATRNEKLEFSSCREGLKKLNTKNCDGTSLFKP